jgi:hypothetical protein
MSVFVLLISLFFVATGGFLLAKGHDPEMVFLVIVFFAGCAAISAWDLVGIRLRRPVLDRASLDPPECMEPILVRRSASHYIVYAFGGGCFMAAGVAMAGTGGAPIASWAVMTFSAFVMVVLVWQVLDFRPRLTIDEEGIADRTLGVGKILWSDVEGAFIRSIEGNDFICLIVRDPEVYLERMGPIRRRIARANWVLGFTELNLNLGGVTVRTEAVLDLIHRHMHGVGGVCASEFVQPGMNRDE